MKKFLTIFLSVMMICMACVPAFAGEIHTDGNQDGQTTVKYGIAESYTVTIPDAIVIPSYAEPGIGEVSVSNAMLYSNSSLSVYVTGDTWNDVRDAWVLTDVTDDANTLDYTISINANALAKDDVVMSVAAGEAYNSTVTKALTFALTEEPTTSGTYESIITFVLEAYSTNVVLDTGFYLGNLFNEDALAPLSEEDLMAIATIDDYTTPENQEILAEVYSHYAINADSYFVGGFIQCDGFTPILYAEVGEDVVAGMILNLNTEVYEPEGVEVEYVLAVLGEGEISELLETYPYYVVVAKDTIRVAESNVIAPALSELIYGGEQTEMTGISIDYDILDFPDIAIVPKGITWREYIRITNGILPQVTLQIEALRVNDDGTVSGKSGPSSDWKVLKVRHGDIMHADDIIIEDGEYVYGSLRNACPNCETNVSWCDECSMCSTCCPGHDNTCPDCTMTADCETCGRCSDCCTCDARCGCGSLVECEDCGSCTVCCTCTPNCDCGFDVTCDVCERCADCCICDGADICPDCGTETCADCGGCRECGTCECS